MLPSHQWKTLLFCCFWLVDGSTKLRGIDPQKISLYTGDHFSCFDGSAVIPSASINDNYCDCLDGSDEPGTSACVHGRFFCQNRGYHSVWLSSTFVDDGFCDCCDGSDEIQGCENRCFVLGAKLRRDLEAKKNDYAKALKEKIERLEKVHSIKEEWKRELDQVKTDIVHYQGRCSSLKKQLDILETAERQRTAPINSNATEINKSEEPTRTEADPDLTESSSKHKDLDESEGEETYGDSERIDFRFDENNDVHDDDETESKGQYEYDRNGGEEDENDDEDSETVIDDDEALSLKESREPSLLSGLSNWVHSFFHRPKEDLEKEPRKEDRRGRARSQLQQIRKDHSKASTELRDAERQRDSLNEKLGRDYGPDSKFVSLVDVCFKLQQDKYEYEICPFDKAGQKEKNRYVNLGKFQGFDDDYGAMEFGNGQLCGHGKHRTLKVLFICGHTDAIQCVDEPDVCQYAANFTTPIACSQQDLDEVEIQLLSLQNPTIKDEL